MSIPCAPAVDLELNTQRYQVLATSKYRLHLTVGATNNIDKHIFVFKQTLERDPASGLFSSIFEAVATPIAMSEFKIDVPNAGQVFSRSSEVTLEFDALPLAIETESLIRADVQQLIEDTKAILASWQSETVEELS